jgi:hypothetical protein
VTTRGYLIAAGAGLLALVAAFLGGRFSAPVRTVEREKVVEKSVRDEHAISQAVAEAQAAWNRSVADHTVTRTIYKEGKPVERVVYVNRETQSAGSSQVTSTVYVDRVVHEVTTQTVTETKIEEGARPGWRGAFSAGWGPDLTAHPSTYGGELSRRLIGPVWVGVWGRTDKTGGVSLALEW